MPQDLLKLIQDSQTQLWLIGYNPEAAQQSTFGNEGDAIAFKTDEIRDGVLAELNAGLAVPRYIGGDRPPVKPPNP